MAITEPGCGSDPSKVQTTAVLDGDEWVINGEKIFVTTGCKAEGVVVWATIDKSAGRAGIKSFLIEKGTPGFVVAHKEKKLGIRADDTAAYVFKDCRIPRANLLGGDESIPKESSGGFKRRAQDLQHDAARGGCGRARHGAGGARLHARPASRGRHRDRVRRVACTASRPWSRSSSSSRRWSRRPSSRSCAPRGSSGEGKPNNLEASVCKAKAGTVVRQVTQGCIELLGPLGRLARAPAREVVPRRAHHRHLRGHGRDPAHDHRARELLGYTRAELN